MSDIKDAINNAFSGNINALRSLADQGIDLNNYDDDGWTPLLAASVRGRSEAVDYLLNSGVISDLPHKISGALPIHFAGHSGNIKTAELLLNKHHDHLNAVWELNGHTLFLQAVFYSHLELAEFALKRGANTAATTVRGLGGYELAKQFQNEELMALIEPYDKTKEEKERYYQALLKKIAPTPDRLVDIIESGLRNAKDSTSTRAVLEEVKSTVEKSKVDVNELGGPLQQPPLIVVVTGNNGDPINEHIAQLRKDLAAYLLEQGADPLVCEKHPMAVNAIIRAAVFNHLEVLELMSERISSEQLTAALNERPVVNGLTALHDTVLRASTAKSEKFEGYLRQINWCIARGARSDIEDFSGRTQRDLAESVKDSLRREKILNALGL